MLEREISVRAVACPGCGAPTSEGSIARPAGALSRGSDAIGPERKNRKWLTPFRIFLWGVALLLGLVVLRVYSHPVFGLVETKPQTLVEERIALSEGGAKGYCFTVLTADPAGGIGLGRAETGERDAHERGPMESFQ